MTRAHADVAIVGGGPGGAWAAYLLARRGARVLLFDASHPREKPCGGGVTGRALALLGDLIDPARIPMSVIRATRFIDARPGKGDAVVDLDDVAPQKPQASTAAEPPLVVTSRMEFDQALLTLARDGGVELVAERVRHIAPCVTGPCRFEIVSRAETRRAAHVIGADGATSLVRRRLGGSFTRSQLSMATGYFVAGMTSDEITIELLSEPPGYAWSFPRPSHLAVGVCAQADAGMSIGPLREHAMTCLRAAVSRAWSNEFSAGRDGRRNGLSPESCASGHSDTLQSYSWPIPSLGARDFERLSPSGPGWCLIGDAAGLVDPITREGIYFALLSARSAADALAADTPAWWNEYRDRIHEEIGLELARAARLKATFFGPRFIRLLMDALHRSEPIRRVMRDLIAGRQSYAALKRRLLETCLSGPSEALLALRSVGAVFTAPASRRPRGA